MKAAVITHWTGMVPGREREALQLAREGSEFWGKHLEEGRIDDFAWFLGSEGISYQVIRGDEASLREIGQTPEALLLGAKSSLLMTDYGYGLFATGDAAEAMMGVYEQMTKELQLV